MTAKGSATASEKTGHRSGVTDRRGADPFQEILAREAQEKERLDRELTAMRGEETRTERALAQKVAEEQERLKEEASVDLKRCREEECAPLLRDAQAEAEQRATSLEHLARGRFDQQAAVVVEGLLADSPLV